MHFNIEGKIDPLVLEELEDFLDGKGLNYTVGNSGVKALRRELHAQAILKGATCPVCDQFAKVYKRKVNSSMARGLIGVYRAFGREYGYVQDVRRAEGATDNREESKLRFWGLLEEDPNLRDDGGRAGYWRVTDKGEQWILRKITIPKYAILYNGKCIGHEGEEVQIVDALGNKFNYRELMSE